MEPAEQNITADPFAYLDRNRFTSEKFKIEIRGLPKFYGLNEFRKLLNAKLKLNACKIKPPKRRSEWLYVCFRTEDDRETAIQKLSGYVWKNKTLTAHAASAVPDPLVQRRNDPHGRTTRKKFDKKLSADELLKSSTVPLWNMSYADQLAMKTKNMRTILEEMSTELLRDNKYHKTVDFLEEQCKLNDGIVCELSNIRHVPFDQIQHGYRNKCEFSIGMNEETGLKTVGFRFGAYVDGSTNIGSVNNLPHVPERMKQVVNVTEILIRKSDLNTYNAEDHSGFWKQVTVRLGGNTGELMVVIGGNAESITNDQLQLVKKDIVNFFENEEGRSCKVTSLYFQNTSTKSKNFDEKSLELLLGAATITEELCGLKFSISPFSFFQIHTAAAEILFDSVAELIPSSKNVTMLDICCGTGSIGLCLSKKCDQILGIESEPAAIENAKINCAQNDVENCTFYHGKAEEILPSVIYKAKHDDIVAVVDPPRAGLHKKAIAQLRRTSKIKKLIYLSCNPKAALQNFIDFGRRPSKTLQGSPFFPVKAIPVDNFPHTSHCELILYFERYDNESADVGNEENGSQDLSTVEEDNKNTSITIMEVTKEESTSKDDSELIFKEESENVPHVTMEICNENKNE